MGTPTASDESRRNELSRRDELARLRSVVERTRPVSTADQRLLPVLGVFEDLLPGGGLQRGSVVRVRGPVAATSLAFALAAGPTRAGSWVACVGATELGWAAAAESGIELERLVVVRPSESTLVGVLATLVDAFDVVVWGLSQRTSGTDARRLRARARERGAVLVLVDPRRRSAASDPWPEAADLELRGVGADWSGIGQGWGRLTSRRLVVEVTGRRGATRPRRGELLLPGPTGAPSAAVEVPDSSHGPGSVASVVVLRGERSA